MGVVWYLNFIFNISVPPKENKMTTPWSGVTSAYEHKHNPKKQLDPTTPKGFRKVWLLDAQWSTCPIEVEAQVQDLWAYYELNNNHCVLKTTLDDLENPNDIDATVNVYDPKLGKRIDKPLKTDLIVRYIKEQAPDLDPKDQILIHWWW